jgi:hypothetical protein
MQRLLAAEDTKIVIPFAPYLAKEFPAERPESRRAFGHLLTIIEAVVLLHCRQRHRDGDGALEAVEEDYDIARSLLAGPIAQSIGLAVSDGAKRFFKRLTKWAPAPPETFTSTDAYSHEDFSDTQIRTWLMELASRRTIELVEAQRGRPTIYRLIPERTPDDIVVLPSLSMSK